MSGDGVQRGIGQAARVLEVIASAPDGMRLTDVASRLGIPKATAHRVLRSWTELGYVRPGSDGRFWLGWRLFELAARHGESVDLRALARPHLLAVNAESGETAHLTVLERGEILYVDKVETREPIRVYAAIGRRAPLHATASGKAILAYQPAAFIASYVERGLERFTDTTLATAEALDGEAETIRKRGYAVNHGEWHREVGSVAAPVLRADGLATAALSATMPRATLTPSRARRLGALLAREGRLLSHSLGHVDGGIAGAVSDKAEESA